jgi:hypothetical protein
VCVFDRCAQPGFGVGQLSLDQIGEPADGLGGCPDRRVAGTVQVAERLAGPWLVGAWTALRPGV